MVADAEYRLRAAGLDHPQLVELWEGIRRGDTPGWAAGRAFEYLILRAFQLVGAEVEWPYLVYDEMGTELEQIDGAIFVRGFGCIIEAKDHGSQPVNVQPVAKLRNQLLRRPAATLGLAFSRTRFSRPARILARYLADRRFSCGTATTLT